MVRGIDTSASQVANTESAARACPLPAPWHRSKGQREANILNGQYDLARIAHLPDALDLVERMIQVDPAHRCARREAVGGARNRRPRD